MTSLASHCSAALRLPILPPSSWWCLPSVSSQVMQKRHLDLYLHQDASICGSKLLGLPCTLCQCSVFIVVNLRATEHPMKVHVLRTWPELLSLPCPVLSPTSHRICLWLSFSQQEKLAASMPDRASELLAYSQNSRTLAAVNFLELRALWYFAVTQIYKGRHSSRTKVSAVSSS